MRSIVNRYRYHEQGATSLVIVMFSVLLFVVVAVGFVQLMTDEQRSSTDNELSRGAYDSALAGVEDGKRVLKACLDGDADACGKINDHKCTTVSDAGLTTAREDGQVYLRSVASGGGLTDAQYEQAYTCVKVELNTRNYLGYLGDDSGSSSIIIPLKTAEEASRVKLQWFGTSVGVPGGVLEGLGTAATLPAKSGWPALRPPILRVELINLQDKSITTLDGADGQRTAYLYPKRGASAAIYLQGLDGRDHSGSGTLAPQRVGCNDDITTNVSGYVCNVTLVLPDGIDTRASNIYLRVTSFYNSADISVSPQKLVGTELQDVKYVGVQPAIDSTGRAGDVFRRVEARVETTDGEVAYPRATIDITNNLCKTLSVTSRADEYDAGSCVNP